MTNRYFRGAMLAAILPALALTACSDDKDEPAQGPDTPDTPAAEAKFVFATTVQGSNGTTNVLLTGESLDEGTITTVGNGLQNDGATQWVFYRDYLYALTYNQGNAGTTRSYILNAQGEMEARNRTYKINRFSSYGAYDNNIITMSTGAGPEHLPGRGEPVHAR